MTSTYVNPQKWEVLSAIAGEYEELEDYGMAETYWNKCQEIEEACGSDTTPGHVAKRGDFLYRRCRYEEAVATYEKALKALRVLEDKRISLENLMICARIGPCIIYSSLMLMIDNPGEKYNNELRHAIDSFISTEKHADNEETAYYLSKAAWELYADEDIVD